MAVKPLKPEKNSSNSTALWLFLSQIRLSCRLFWSLVLWNQFVALGLPDFAELQNALRCKGPNKDHRIQLLDNNPDPDLVFPTNTRSSTHKISDLYVRICSLSIPEVWSPETPIAISSVMTGGRNHAPLHLRGSRLGRTNATEAKVFDTHTVVLFTLDIKALKCIFP